MGQPGAPLATTPVRRSLLAAAVLALAAPPVAAQLSVGVGGYAVDYAPGAGADTTFAFNSDVYAVGFYGTSGLLHVFYGTDVKAGAAPGDSTEARALGVDLATEGGVTVARLGGGGVTVALSVPLQLALGYRYLREGPALRDGAAPTPATDDAERTLHLGTAALGAGGGAAVEVPLAGLPLARRLTGAASFVVGAGVQADFDPAAIRDEIGQGGLGEPGGLDAYGLRTTALSVQVGLDGVLGSDLGVYAGYTLRTARAATVPVESAADLLDVVTGGGEYADLETLHLARIGLSF